MACFIGVSNHVIRISADVFEGKRGGGQWPAGAASWVESDKLPTGEKCFNRINSAVRDNFVVGLNS